MSYRQRMFTERKKPYLSPFWRSPIPFGKKNSCRAQIAPATPVARRPPFFFVLAWSTARRPLQVDGCMCVRMSEDECMHMINNISYTSIGLRHLPSEPRGIFKGGYKYTPPRAEWIIMLRVIGILYLKITVHGKNPLVEISEKSFERVC